METYLEKNKGNYPTTKVRILVNKKVAKHLDYEKKHHGFVSQKPVGNDIEMTFMSSNIEEYFPRWFMMFGDYATILEPESLKKRVLELIEKSLLRLKK